MKKYFFGTNTKMFKTPSEAAKHVEVLKELTKDIKDKITLFVIPSYTSLFKVTPIADFIKIGSQSIGWEERGQLTGEISPLMLEELGVTFSMIGHSERRHILHETDEEEGKRVACCMRNNFTALLCVGETKEQKDNGLTEEVIKRQLTVGLSSVKKEETGNIWIAYEPVWAIGVNGTPATADYAEKIHKFIKKTLYDLFEDASNNIPVLYGGSVNNGNCVELIKQENIDGLFIGRSAWDAENFNKIIRLCLKKKANIA